ncbi:MAG: SseB family protein [Bdellovibrionales bacterium]|nr:SseB family protein [Bdellovibrionales bacterium]
MSTEANILIEEALDKALDGDREATERVYLAFLNGPLYVPIRYQSIPFAPTAEYPNDLISIFAVRENDTTFVPVFSSPEQIEIWCERQLEFRCYTGADLCTIIPDGWWIALNPGADANKEISFWEIEQLRFGKDSIPTLLSEYNLELVEQFSTEQIPLDQYPKLVKALSQEALNYPQIVRMHILREDAKNIDGEVVQSILVGIQVHCDEKSLLSSIEEKFSQIADRSQIGDHPVKVLLGNSSESLSLGIFKRSRPFYTRPLRLGAKDFIRNLLK